MLKFNYDKLFGKITEILGTKQIFCENMIITYQSFRNKVTGKSFFNQMEMVRAAALLDFSIDEIPAYFFVTEDSKSQKIKKHKSKLN